jgi:hypothetical protein
MKKNLLLVFVLVLTIQYTYGQNPSLKLVGSNVSFTKGTIDVEVLSQLIQQKQEEVKKRVFRNIVVNNFNNTWPNSGLRNFTTYYFFYNLLNDITQGKNKTALTKSIIQNTAEYCLVASFAKYLDTKLVDSSFNKFRISGGDFVQDDSRNQFIRRYNLLIDVCYDEILNDTSVQNKFKFSKDTSDREYKIWYQQDNVAINTNPFKLKREKPDSLKNEYGYTKQEIENIRREVKAKMANFFQLANTTQTTKNFLSQLEWKNLTIDSLKKEQYESMKTLLKEAAKLAKNRFQNDVVSNILDFLIENTIIEYSNDSDKGQLYVDVESLILQIDQHFNNPKKRSSISKNWLIPRPFLTIGASQAIFFNKNNNLTTDGNGNTQSLDKLYYASEKIGFEIKLFDKAYSRSFQPGEKFLYKGTERIWFRPQNEALISDIHLIAYASGLLYNLANLKSDKNFNKPLIGLNIGANFFNDLKFSVGVGLPIIKDIPTDKKLFFNFGFDIPIVDYINALAKKNK